MALTKVTGQVIEPTTNVQVGIITATKFVGDGSVLTGVGIGTTGAVNTSGVGTFSEVKANGIGVTSLNVAGVTTFKGDVLWDNSTNAGKDILWDESDNSLIFSENVNIKMQDSSGGQNVSISNGGSGLSIGAFSGGTVKIAASGGTWIRNQAGEFNIKCNSNASTDLYYANVKTFETVSGGAKVTGALEVTGNVSVGGTLTYEDVTNIDSVGIVTARTGVHIDDSITHIGDTNTKIRFPANDTITAETAGTERLRIDSSGHMGLGITPSDIDSIGRALNIASSTGGAIYLQDTDAPTVKFGAISYNGATAALQIHAHHGSSYIDLGTNGTERVRIDSGGRLLVGTTTNSSPIGWNNNLQVAGTSAVAGVSIRRDENSTGGALLVFGKSRGSLNGNTIVQSGDQIGGMYFAGADGTDVNSIAAQMSVEVDGTPGGNDMPGRILFKTTADGAASPTERLRITSNGNIGLGGITSPLWTTGGGMHLNDAYGIGFGNGGNGRPDFQIACVDGSKLEFRCGFGADTADIVMETSGELGIGIQSPSSPLHAYHATTNTIAQFESGDAGAGILLKDNTHYTRLESTNGTFKIDVDAGSQIGSEVISFQVSNSEKLRITSAGEVLIGRTAKPNDINKLVVTGTSPADAYDSTLYLEGSETSGAINTGGALAFGGHDGGAARNWANIYGMKENGTGSNTAAYMSFHTRPAGGGPTERLRITSSGQIKKAQGANVTSLKTYNSNADAFWLDHYQYQDAGEYRRYTDIVSIGDGSWGSHIRVFGNDDSSGNAIERLHMNHKGYVYPTPGGGNIMGVWKYRQRNQSTNYEHIIRGPYGNTIATDMDGNAFFYIEIAVVGTGTGGAWCEYHCNWNSSESGATLTHVRGNSGASSNRPYMVLNSNQPYWKMNHNGSYDMDIKVSMMGGKTEVTFTGHGSYTSNP